MKSLSKQSVLSVLGALALTGCQFFDNVQFADAAGSQAVVDFGKVTLPNGCAQAKELRLENRGMAYAYDLRIEISPKSAFLSPAEKSDGSAMGIADCPRAAAYDRPAQPSGGGNGVSQERICGTEADRLAPGESCRIPVYFQPSRIGKYSAKMLVSYTGQYGARTLSRGLTGEAVEAPQPKGSVTFESLGRAPFPGRRQASLAVLKDQVFMTGGERLSDVWSTKNGRDWNLLTDRAAFGGQNGADYHKLIAHNDALYVFALWNGDRGLWTSRDGMNWTKTAAALGSRSSYCAVSHRGQMLVIGGWTGRISNEVLASADGVKFSQTIAPFAARMDHRCVSNGQQVFVIGGHNESASLTDVWSSVDGKNWTKLADNYGTAYFNSSADVVFSGGYLVILDADKAYISKDGKTFEAIPSTRRELWERGDTVLFNGRLLSMTTPYAGSSYENELFLGALKLPQ